VAHGFLSQLAPQMTERIGSRQRIRPALDLLSVRAALVTLVVALAPNTADAIPLIPTGTIAFPFTVDVRGSIFLRSRSNHIDGRHFRTEIDLTRARIGLDLRWKNYVRIQLEPEFAQVDAEPADLFAQISPIDEVSLIAGRHKVPFGEVELESRWRLPSLSRGLLSELVSDRLDIGDRLIGATGTLRFKDVFLRPGLAAGAYRDSLRNGVETDYAVRLQMRPYLKGSELAVAGYARANARAQGGYGFAGSGSFHYDRGGIYAVFEWMVVRAILLRKISTFEDATLSGGRLLAAYAFAVSEVTFEPFLGLELIDPNVRTKDDLGGAVRFGINLLFASILRLGLEFDIWRGQEFFPELDQTRITVLLGVSLE